MQLSGESNFKNIVLRKTCLAFSGIFFLLIQLSAQEARQYSFTHYGVQNGLAAYNVHSLIQDETGFIWIGTINGLQRFDGTRFITFRHNPADPASLPDNNVEQLLIDSNKNLWLVLADGSIGVFDTKRFLFRKALVKLHDQNNLQALRKLQADKEGHLFFVFLSQEILTYNSSTNEFSAANNFIQLPGNFKPINLVQDSLTKKYWIGTDSGLVVYNRASRKTSYYGHNAEAEPCIERLGKIPAVGCYSIDKKRRLWFLSWPANVGASRLYCYDLTNSVEVLHEYDLVPVMKQYIEPDFFLEQQDGSIWISGLNILVKFDEAKKMFQPVGNSGHIDQGIYYERANMFEDREQNLWVATSNNGVYAFNTAQQIFTNIKHQNRLVGGQGNGYLISFAQAANGTVLAGVWGDGIYRYDQHFNNIPLGINGIPEINGLPVWDICRLKNKPITWLVGQPGFIYLYDEQKQSAKRYDPAIFETRTIRQAEEDRFGNVWLGSQSRGLIKWAANRATPNFEDGFYKIQSIPNQRVKRIITDSKGFIWVCTNKEGVYKIDPSNDSIVDHLTKTSAADKRLLSNDASAIMEYNDSIVLIATGGLNIYNTRSKNMRYITSADGLPSDAVVSMEKDRGGYAWLGLMTGLCRFKLENKSFTFFDRSDGIANDNFQVAASFRLPDGRLLFGSSNDFVVFDPEAVKTTTAPPSVTITEIRLPNRVLSVDSIKRLNRVELTADQNSITIGFAGLTYLNKSKPVYYYQMEGIDQEWKKANELNQAVYNYLPAGNYTFKVRAENADGFSGHKITLLLIKVKPPFWKTWWFVSLLAFAAIGFLYWIDKFRVARIRDTERVRTRIATSLTRDMSSTLSNINVLSEMAKVKADKNIDRTKEYIDQISENSQRMMEVMDDMIWSINPENDELQYTILRMKKYAANIQSKYNLEVAFAVDEKAKEIKLHMDRRHELFLVFKEALLNAGKHSGGRFADVHVSYENNRLTMTMVDNGRGFSIKELGFSRGLNEMQKRAAALKASFQIVSEINTGTTVTFVMMV